MNDNRDTPIDSLYREGQSIICELKKANQPSLETAANASLGKSLIIAAASYFERMVCDFLLKMVDDRTNNFTPVTEFVRTKTISRQYHTFFDWEKLNANHFFNLFGKDFSDKMKNKIKESSDLEEAIKGFMEIGSQRNNLVHNDYATYPLNKTAEEIYESYKRGLRFVKKLPDLFESSRANLSQHNATDGLFHCIYTREVRKR